MLEQELVEHQRLARNDAEGVAVGRRLGTGARADIECSAGAVLDDERLAQALCSSSASARMKMSLVPPALEVAITRTGRAG